MANRKAPTVRGNNLKSKCAGCVGAVGIAFCTISMSLGAVGIVAVGVSQKSSGMANMGGSGSSVAANNPSLLSQVILLLSGFWGEVILFVSFGLMIAGMMYAKKLKPLAFALSGAAVLFVGMYVYFAIGLEILGWVALILAYVGAYNRKAAILTKLA